ncbi:MAG: hypothetical protein M1839_004822 [Geoglossum umbratile]|nr:MAG: hypothetical protein M1839_004822 [Geoglossum umbratile]
MSKSPLFLRSSPAQGTGSYGALPVIRDVNLSSEVDSSDLEEYDLDDVGGRSQRKKLISRPTMDRSSRLRVPETQNTRDSSSSSAGSSSGRNGVFLLGSRKPPAGADAGGDILERLPLSLSNEAITDDQESEDTRESTDTDGGGHGEDDPPDNSPYAQVRASVSATDDTSLSISTPRMWTLSVLFSIIGSGTNLMFSLRYPSISITPVIALLLVHPLGLLWDKLLKRDDDPEERFLDGVLEREEARGSPYVSVAAAASDSLTGRIGSSSSDLPQPARRIQNRDHRGIGERLRLWLAQGRWNQKEHSCVYVSSNVSFGFAFATDVIVEQTQFYHQNPGIAYQILLTLSTQILGYAFAGLTRRYLVRPGGMIWPGTLMSTAMFTTLHRGENKAASGWTISRWKFFLAAFIPAFFWYFVPGLLMPALSYFNIVTWFAPKSVVVANLFGVVSGLGLFPLTFDWSQIAYTGSPLLTPWWAALNVVGGLVVVMWVVAPILYYNNVLYSSYMPILSSSVFDNKGHHYDVSKILTADFLFDKEAYQRYSRVFLPITYVLSYGLQFAALAALITHTACWHWRDIWRQWKRSSKEAGAEKMNNTYRPLPPGSPTVASSTKRKASGDNYSRRQSTSSNPGLENLMGGEDVHCRLMRRYKDAPISWYLITFATMTAVGIFVVEYYPVHLPWYGLLLALGICGILFIPIGIVMAITNQQSSLYLICQLICGVVFPGRPVANMVFVTYGYITSTQGLKFTADLKLGHYMKIPPRTLFSVQMVSTVVSSLTQISVLNWMFRNIPNICTPEALNGFTCPIARVHFNGSILWGVVGPRRFFGEGAIYRPLTWAFLGGALAPIGVWLLGRRNRKSIWRKVNLPVLFGSLSWIPPAVSFPITLLRDDN